MQFGMKLSLVIQAIASSVVKLLEDIVKLYPSDFTLWSDSCVPQNKNSVMSCALIAVLNRNVHVKSIIQKFGEPGHSPVQEVDNLQSQIERKLKTKMCSVQWHC